MGGPAHVDNANTIAHWRLDELSDIALVVDSTGLHAPFTLPGRLSPGAMEPAPGIVENTLGGFEFGSRFFDGSGNDFAIGDAEQAELTQVLYGGQLWASFWVIPQQDDFQTLMELAPDADEDGTSATNSVLQLSVLEGGWIDVGFQTGPNDWTDLISTGTIPQNLPTRVDVTYVPENLTARSPAGQAALPADDSISGIERTIIWPAGGNGQLYVSWRISDELPAADHFALYIDGVNRAENDEAGPGSWTVGGGALAPGSHLIQIFWFHAANTPGDETYVELDEIIARNNAGVAFETWTFNNDTPGSNVLTGWSALAPSFVNGWLSDPPNGDAGSFVATPITQLIKIYLNGVLDRTFAGQPLPTYGGTLPDLKWVIGTDRGPNVNPGLYGGYLLGILDDLFLENIAPDAAAIAADYTLSTGGLPPGEQLPYPPGPPPPVPFTPGGYTNIAQIGVQNSPTTFTHGLSITPSLLVARMRIHQPRVTCTTPPIVCTIGTNIITVASAGSLVTCDLEVTRIHSILGGT